MTRAPATAQRRRRSSCLAAAFPLIHVLCATPDPPVSHMRAVARVPQSPRAWAAQPGGCRGHGRGTRSLVLRRRARGVSWTTQEKAGPRPPTLWRLTAAGEALLGATKTGDVAEPRAPHARSRPPGSG